MRCLSLGTPPVLAGGGGGGGPGGSSRSTNGAHGSGSNQLPENLSASSATPGKEPLDASGVNELPLSNGQSAANFTMMHPAFQQQHQQQQPPSHPQSEHDKLSKTYTELKLYKEPTAHSVSQLDLGGMAALAPTSDEGSDGSDSEEIDLTSGACIDFSHKQQQQQQQHQQQATNLAGAQPPQGSNGVH